MNTRLITFLMMASGLFPGILAQEYYISDSLVLVNIDAACDVMDSLNWNTEQDPGKWDGIIWSSSIPKHVKEIWIDNKGLSDTLYITQLDSLTKLYCRSNQLTDLQLSNLPNLLYLSCYYNIFTDLELSDLPELININCRNNNIDNLNLDNLPSLQVLSCNENQLTELDLHDLNNLIMLQCFGNQITSLDVSSLVSLFYLDCSDNKLTNLNVIGLSELGQIFCEYNKLKSLDLTDASSLEYLWCDNNELITLDVSGTDLWELACHNNLLTSLDVSMLSNLLTLACYGNQLPFSSLVTGIDIENFYYAPQETLFVPDTIQGNIVIDYSKEAFIHNTSTEFVFFRNGSPSDTNTSGFYSTVGPGIYYCEMTNALFPGLRLSTAPISIVEGSGIELSSLPEIITYPNPVKDKLYLSIYGCDLIKRLFIYDINGIELIQFENISSPFVIDMTSLIPGTYFFKIDLSELSKNFKIVKL